MQICFGGTQSNTIIETNTIKVKTVEILQTELEIKFDIKSYCMDNFLSPYRDE